MHTLLITPCSLNDFYSTHTLGACCCVRPSAWAGCWGQHRPDVLFLCYWQFSVPKKVSAFPYSPMSWSLSSSPPCALLNSFHTCSPLAMEQGCLLSPCVENLPDADTSFVSAVATYLYHFKYTHIFPTAPSLPDVRSFLTSLLFSPASPARWDVPPLRDVLATNLRLETPELQLFMFFLTDCFPLSSWELLNSSPSSWTAQEWWHPTSHCT